MTPSRDVLLKNGQCKRTKRNGDRCGNPVRTGYTVCSSHGAGRKGKDPGAPIQHGLRTMEFKRLGKRGRERIAELQGDPDLLNATRPVAVQTFLLESLDLDFGDDDKIMLAAEELARRKNRGIEPSEGEILLARAEIIDRASIVAERLGKTQESAAKQQLWKDLLLTALVPKLQMVAQQLGAVVDRHVPKAAQVEARKEIKAIFAAFAGGIAEAKISALPGK